VTAIQRLSGRGRTSGIGIHGFFSGGWIVDVGQQAGSPLLPSAANRKREVAVALTRIESPDWPVGLFHPYGASLSGIGEIDFFRASTPIGEHEVLRALACLYHGMLPALLTRDIDSFGDALRSFQSLGFKRKEIDQQAANIKRLIGDLRDVAPGVGMSSMGPLIFAFGGAPDDLAAIAGDHNVGFDLSSVDNRGWRMENG